jgi:hypothetical protein
LVRSSRVGPPGTMNSSSSSSSTNVMSRVSPSDVSPRPCPVCSEE